MAKRVVQLSDRMSERVRSLLLDWQSGMLLASSRATASPQSMIRTQGSFLGGVEKTVNFLLFLFMDQFF